MKFSGMNYHFKINEKGQNLALTEALRICGVLYAK